MKKPCGFIFGASPRAQIIAYLLLANNFSVFVPSGHSFGLGMSFSGETDQVLTPFDLPPRSAQAGPPF